LRLDALAVRRNPRIPIFHGFLMHLINGKASRFQSADFGSEFLIFGDRVLMTDFKQGIKRSA
jgi:hypothetical protein